MNTTCPIDGSTQLLVPHHTSLRTSVAYYLIYPTAKRTLPWPRLFRDWLLGVANEMDGILIPGCPEDD